MNIPLRRAAARRWLSNSTVGFALLLGSILASPAHGAEPAAAQSQLRTGEYEQAIAAAQKAVAAGERGDEWHLILLEGLLAVGRYPEAYSAWTNALAKEGRSVRVRWLGREALLANGEVADARSQLREIAQLVSSRPGNYRDVPSLVIFGQSALASGADPKVVLERIYEMARKADPKAREVYLASGGLALEKGDFALAARRFDEGLKQSTNDADLHFGRAKAFAESDREEAAKSLAAALQINPRHTPSLLLMADHRIDAEDYSGASELLGEIQKYNPNHPEAAAYRAVIAHLRNQPEAEKDAVALALRYWTNNPRVPYLIGTKLSRKYRFAEGAKAQRDALRFDPEYLPAKAALANDLLRLGDEAEGWQLAQEVHAKDGYDVTMFNLVTLHDTLTNYTTLSNDHFTVRMHSQEAAIYGPRVLALLERARQTLVPKYGVTLKEPTVVEIFASSKDFGVRTFGIPDNPGYLGVCFGRVVTANSPATNPGGTVNWEAVLWHEFCHVVTLQLTRNKMPRWLSEGISVHEERQANPAWGEQLTPKYREMILGEDLTPVSRLSAAFLMPKSSLHLQFAYYESSLVVEFLIERFGVDGLKAVLLDLRDGVFINDSLEKHTLPMDALEREFAAYARKKAESLAPGLDWTKPEFAKASQRSVVDLEKFDAAMMDWSATRPTNFWALDFRAQTLLTEKNWTDAKVPLQTLIDLYPSQTGAGSARERMARVHRELDETNAEWSTLLALSEREAAAPEAFLRLMELAAARQDWPVLRQTAERYLAVNPLIAPPYRYLAEASEKTGAQPEAVAAYQTLLRLDPLNPSTLHTQIARLLQKSDRTAARKHTLAALEETPRNREALQLLLQLSEASTQPASTPNP
ncbi:MAG: tetratricopeptide repeat protein [Verrucomicrobia bacterium]|nr:tetratricopeptide repeat protein [Verrucomicrobiota bacterium]